MNAPIQLTYNSIDGYTETRTFKTIKGARSFVNKWTGPNGELGSGYIVSGDGVGTVRISGRYKVGDYIAQTTLQDLI